MIVKKRWPPKLLNILEHVTGFCGCTGQVLDKNSENPHFLWRPFSEGLIYRHVTWKHYEHSLEINTRKQVKIRAKSMENFRASGIHSSTTVIIL